MVLGEVGIQLKRCTDPAGITISFKLSDLRSLHAFWILDFYKYMFEQPQMTVNCFHGTGIIEAVNEAKTFLDSVENPFKDAFNIAWT